MKTPTASGSQIVLGASPLDIIVNSRAPLYLNLADNILAGTSAGVPVTILPEGKGPGWTVDYGTQQTIPLAGVRWLRIVGEGANITYNLSEENSPVGVSVVGANPGESVGTAFSNMESSPGGTALLTALSGTKLRIFRLQVNGATNSTFILWIEAKNSAFDYITAPAGDTNANGTWTMGQGPGNNVQLENGLTLLDGDTIAGQSLTGSFLSACAISYLSEPL